jgi:hypothetical protein
VLGVVDVSRPAARGKATESATISRFCSGVAPRTSRTWSSQLLPKMQTTGVSAATIASEIRVRLGAVVLVPSRAEGGELGGLPFDRPGGREEVDVLGVRARPAALDVGEARIRRDGERS